MDTEFWNAVASAASTYVEGQELAVPCSLRISYRLRCIEVLAFVGRYSDGTSRNIVAELESQGFRVLGCGVGETGLSWGAVVELPGGEDCSGPGHRIIVRAPACFPHASG